MKPTGSTFTSAERGLIASAAVLVFSRVFAFSLVLPGFRDFGATLTDSGFLVGFALGAYGLTMAAAQLANGWLSDHVGRRPVLLAGSALFVLGSIWAALAGSIETLIAARLLQGLGGVSSVAMAAVGETVPEERRTTAMALVGVPAGLGFFLGFLLGPLGADVAGFRSLFWAMAALGVVAAMPLALRPLPPRGLVLPSPAPATAAPALTPAPATADIPASRLPVVALAMAGFAVNLAMAVVAFFLPDVGHLALAAMLLGALVVMGLASRIVDRGAGRDRNAAGAIAIGLMALAAGAPLFTLRGGGLLLAGGLAFFAAHATLSAVLPSQVSRISGRLGGRGHGVQLVVAYLGTAAGGALAGGLAGAPQFALGALAALCVATALLGAGALSAPPAEPPVNAPGP